MTFLAAILLGVGQPAPQPKLAVPDAFTTAFAALHRQLDHVELCIPEKDDRSWYIRWEALDDQYFTLFFGVRRTWGGLNEEIDDYVDPSEPRDCSPAVVERLMAEIELALNGYYELHRVLARPMAEGLWLGPLKICRANILGRRISEEVDPPGIALLGDLTEHAGRQLAELSARSVNIDIYVKLDGAIIWQPAFNEPIESGGFRIASSDRRVLERAAQAANEPC